MFQRSMKNGISQLCNAFLLSLDPSEITYMQIQPLTDNWQFHQEEKVFPVCDGLDTLATVVLNGHELGHADNMFRQYRWDVRPLLRATDANELRITFASPVRYASEKQKARALPGVSQAIPGGPYLRKAPCQFGWDWGPQLPPVGIWKDLRLEQVHLHDYTKRLLTDVPRRHGWGAILTKPNASR
jgi:beta-galactosidase/beta-glucuronidase